MATRLGAERSGIYEAVARWFETQRGITHATLEAFGIKTSGPEDAPVVTLPYTNGEKTRKGILGGERQFFYTQGVVPGLFIGPQKITSETKTAFLVEGETDTMRLWQELSAAGKLDGIVVVGLSGVNTWTSDKAELLKAVQKVYVILDNDADYIVQAQVEQAWRTIRGDLGQKARRLRLPQDTKDICEFFGEYDLDSLRLVIQAGGGAASRYTPLDFSQPPPPPKWLVEGLISRGDVTLLAGPPGIGKSWFTMGLTLAVIERWKTFLTADMQEWGRVLYVDQENPDDVIFTRLHKLGLTTEGKGNLRYLWNCGIRLDRDSDTFLDEALDFQPTLIVLDSLTRLHTQDENNAGAISALFNEGIQPLARETGAAVLLIHHNNKGGTPRGSIDIEASADNVLHVLPPDDMNPGAFFLKQGKSRRRLGGDSLFVKIEDDPVTNGVRLHANAPINPPF